MLLNELKFIFFAVGILAVGISLKPFLNNIRKHKTKVYFTLPGWTLLILSLGAVLGFGIQRFTPLIAGMIIFGLFALIPLYAWVDAKIIYKNGAWGVKEYFWGCLYEIGLVTIGAALFLIIR